MPNISRLDIVQGLSCGRSGCHCARRSGHNLSTHCPCHEDDKPSLSVTEDNGKVLVKCHGGCDQSAVITALQKLGLWPSGQDVPPRAPVPRKTPRNTGATPTRRIVQTYDYTDEAAGLLFQSVRYEPKGFNQRRRAENGSWLYSLGDVRRVPYRLPEVLAAVKAGKAVWLVEGEKDADALTALGATATCNPMGAGKWLDEYGDALAGANVVILPDNDDPGRSHVQQVAASLQSRARSVRVVTLPDLPDKGDVSDWLAAGGTLLALVKLAKNVPDWKPSVSTQSNGQEAAPPTHPYVETPHGLVWRKKTDNGDVDTPLTNFTARIVADIVEDDGAETRRLFEIDAGREGRKKRISLPAQSFALMNWPMEYLGADALLYPGVGTKDRARFAIQVLSGTPSSRQVYGHSGWRNIGAEGHEWVYLHAGGAIGASGPVQVHLPSERFCLPEPPTGERLIRALRASLGLWKLVDDPISVPLLCSIYRAALGESDFSLFLAGPSGAFKSELAALAQQHFGPGLDARNLPGSWSSTDNALEGLAFAVKDALMVIDDFAPTGSAVDVQRLHAKADRILRGQGNNSGRQRMRADGSLKPPKYPRGLILSTGEDVPQGQSLRARMMVLEITHGMIAEEGLSQCQKLASAGVYAEAMAGFVAYLAPHYAQVHAGLREQTTRLRDQAAASGQHRRTPEIVANLAAGLHWFLACALEAGAITDKERENIWRRGWNALGQAALAQSGHQAASEPTRRFLELLAAALVSGKAHLAGPQGGVPENGAAWGWRQVAIGVGENEHLEWKPLGDRIGWLDGDDVYLQPDAAYNAAKRLGADSGDGITITPRTLNKRLHERWLLASVDEGRGTSTVRRTLTEQRHDVLHLHKSRFESGHESGHEADAPPTVEETAQTDQTAHRAAFPATVSEAEAGASGQFRGQLMGAVAPLSTPGTAHETAQSPDQTRSDRDGNGQFGQFGQFPTTEDGRREVWRP